METAELISKSSKEEQNFSTGENTGGRVGVNEGDFLDKISKVLTLKGC